MTPDLSVFVITQNEAADLPQCLASVSALAGEIIVVDSGSTDATRAIAEGAGARVYERAFDGFAAQKQFALDQCQGQWALSIDADERVSPLLAESIRRIIASRDSADGYAIRRHMHFLGKRLRFGGVGVDYPMRLFRRQKGRYAEVLVHERIVIEGRTARLEAPLEHHSYATLEEYEAKCDHYTTLAASDLWAKGRRFRLWDHARPLWELFSRVILRGAWLDGQAGLVYAALSAHAAWLRSVKLWEIEQRERHA